MANSEASDRIEAALIEALKDKEMSEPGDILDDWLLIGHIYNPSNETHGYPMIFSNGNIPNHVARGLLQTGVLIFSNSDNFE